MYQMMHAERPVDPRETFRQNEVKGDRLNEDDYMNKTRSELLVKVARDIDQASKITKMETRRKKEKLFVFCWKQYCLILREKPI